MRKVFLLICVIGLSSAGLGQTHRAFWEVLSSLKLGQNIQVVDSSSKKHSGTFISVSDSTISLQVPSGEQSIQKGKVRTIKLIGDKRRARNTVVGGVVGGAIGAAGGAIIGAATHKGCSNQTFCLDFIGTDGSAGIGAVIGL